MPRTRRYIFNFMPLDCICVMLLGACALVGCGSYSMPDRNVKRIVSQAEVIGVWKLSTDSLNLLSRDGFKSKPAHLNTITFNADGTLVFASVMEDLQSSTYLKAEGTWKLGQDADGSNVLSLIIESPDKTHHFAFNFAEENGLLVLWAFYGDPDSWEFIEYERARNVADEPKLK